ncbi:ABC transporter substrate-binding protein [Mesorhizobium sp. M0134]|uniref:ABC transporter substrate-binding protein n=1 Tax=Mesorhizobium sp. M0134 TaxID=2956889 RepID=UPI0033361E43
MSIKGKRKYFGPVLLSAAAVASMALSIPAYSAENEIEVVHQWTAAGEAAAMKVLKDAVDAQGLKWVDSPIAGAGGKNMTQALQARFAAGNPPAASQMPGQFVLEYAQAGSLGDLSATAEKEGWEQLVAPALLDYMKVDRKIVAVPLNQRRENMLWINKKVLDRFGGKVPESWDEFLTLAEKIKAGGIIPLALGGDDWQEGEIWTDILIGQAGVDFYKKAVMATDHAAIKSDTMVKVFDTFRKVLAYADPNRAGTDWAIETGKVIKGEAAMQFQGDWANGEFVAVNMKPGVDYLCTAAPGHGHTYVFLTDFFGMFKQPNPEAQRKQEILASAAMSIEVQENLNLKGGSIPARLDVPRDRFNDCSKQAFADREEGMKDGTLIPSFVENNALPRDIRAPYMDVITQFANTPDMTSQQAVDKLVEGLNSL